MDNVYFEIPMNWNYKKTKNYVYIYNNEGDELYR